MIFFQNHIFLKQEVGPRKATGHCCARSTAGYAKIGNRKGKPAYRTPATFRYRKYLKDIKIKTGKKGK